MPKETFWDSSRAVEGDGVSEPVLTVTWGEGTPVHLNGVPFDESGIDRLRNVLRRAQDKTQSTVTINNIPLGNADELAKTITRVIRDARRRGVLGPDTLD